MEPTDRPGHGLGHGPREEHACAGQVQRFDLPPCEDAEPVVDLELVPDPDDRHPGRPAEPFPQFPL